MTTATAALQLENLVKIYDNGHKALKGISLRVNQGDFFALLGPNGAGKSTAIGIISSLINKSSGQVYIFGHNFDTQLKQVKRMLGLVPQEFNFNIFERVETIIINQAGYYGIPYKEASKHTEHLLNQLGLWEKRKDIAHTLSGGMKRRLMIARALVHNPKLLILDEPTAGVDIEIRHAMWKYLREINDTGTTIILTTHYLEEAEKLCRNIAIINEGKIVENTSVKAFLSSLNKETFVLDLQSSIDNLPDCSGYLITKIDRQTIEVEVPKKKGLNSLFKALDKHDIQVLSMRNKTNRLEQLFIDLLNKREKK